MKLPIYLDYAATTPTDPRVVEKMLQYFTLDGNFGNPSSRSHQFGWRAEEAVDIARNQIAELIGADSREIIFTSGATESNNLAIKGAANFYRKKGLHLITTKTEHKTVLDTCAYLESEGFHITYLDPSRNGIFLLEHLQQSLRPDTILVSIMHVNNEIGIIQDITAIGKICREHGVIFHVDATQSIGKLPINLKHLKIDLMSFSAHKIYGPKGIGALFVRNQPRIYLSAQIHGGGHERGMRSGTLPVHQIVGMGKACAIAKDTMEKEMLRICKLRAQLWKGIENIQTVSLNGSLNQGAGHILNISFHNISKTALLISLKDLAISNGSACLSSSLKPSYVLTALGINREVALNSIRFSFGRFTTQEEISYAVDLINKINNQ
ncbi:Cysteine desulfurase IscS [Candidatus Erwinia haradaeae]|uniref:cysteine desulfurase n=1 Tax=Candidatus Erwinia haradaeae TaxID=1922217 RepID=A0A451DJZ8_9GAMM|nr:Cysteine desulfurase IscS [Candidatus Erwinia haradaeae]